ncbi:leucine-rich repeat domain-containing protein [candidate division KSB1 bacterium]
MLFLSGCDLSETVGAGSTPPVARLGEDRTIRVGQYMTLDGSASTAGEGGIIIWWEWGQDENNPDEGHILSGDTRSTYDIGFKTEGVYQFSLTVTNNFGSESEPDTTTITVLPRDNYIFEDANLELKVREYLHMPVEELTEEILHSMDSLKLGYIPYSGSVVSFAGLEYCVNLEYFNGVFQNVQDLSPLTKLIKMRELKLASNEIINISPLAGMTKLEYLQLMNNPVTDISALAGMTELREVYFESAQLTDISPLSGLENLERVHAMHCNIQGIPPLDSSINLTYLFLDFNNITDISSLRNLISLKALLLAENQIEDILPLVENTGIGNGDFVNLYNNPLNEQSINVYIPALRDRGVDVSY